MKLQENKIVLKIRNLKAKLPADFVQIIHIETLSKKRVAKIISGTIDNHIVNGYKMIETSEVFMSAPTQTAMMVRSISNMNRRFRVAEVAIFFDGQYSNFFLFRWMQKCVELLFPEKVIVRYEKYSV